MAAMRVENVDDDPKLSERNTFEDRLQASHKDDSSYEYCKGFSMQQFKELKGEDFQDNISDCAFD